MNDYVWDIFYHRTSKSTNWDKISQNIGTLYVRLHGSYSIVDLPSTSKAPGSLLPLAIQMSQTLSLKLKMRATKIQTVSPALQKHT